MKIKVRKHHIFLYLGAAGSVAAVSGIAASCGDSKTADELKIEAARAKFTTQITAQILTLPSSSVLPVGEVTAEQIASLGGGIRPMPDISDTGASVIYTATALSGVKQVITATISAGTAPVQKVQITLTFSARVITPDQKIQAAFDMFSDQIKTQTLTATIDHALDHTLTTVSRGAINALAGLTHPMPDTTSTGATVTYRAAAPNGRVQVVTATITAAGGTTKTVAINLTFAAAAPLITPDQKIQAAFDMFSDQIKTQTLTATIDHALDHTLTTVSRGAINALAGLTHPMPDTTSTGATVTYHAAAPNGRVQVVTATITAAGGTTKTVAINLTFAAAAPLITPDQKIQAAFEMFSDLVKTQTLTASIDDKLDDSGAHITREKINALDGLVNPMPDTTSTGATVTYTAKTPIGLTQEVTALIEATGGASKTVTITLTFTPHVQTADEKIAAAQNAFTHAIREQTLALHVDHALADNETSATVIDNILIEKLPTSFPDGITVSYLVYGVNRATLVQDITVIINASPTQSGRVSIHLKYAGVTLAEFKAAYPASKISDDGSAITASAFAGVALPTGFALPETVTSIEREAFKGATFAGSFQLPSRVGNISENAFQGATLPTGFVIPPLITELKHGVFASATLPTGFTISTTITTIEAGAFANVVLPEGFTIPEDVLVIRTIKNGAFAGVTLPAGFSIPIGATINQQSADSTSPSFHNVNLPPGYAWRGANGRLIADQTNPVPGCSVSARTDADAIVEAETFFTHAIREQTLTVRTNMALAENETSATVINAALVTKLPTSLPTGVTVTYRVGAVNRATLVQDISVTLSLNSATPSVIHIHLTYVGLTLAQFKAAHPHTISDDGLVIANSAFVNANLAPGFALPETVEIIESDAFMNAIFSGSFKLPLSVRTIQRTAFDSAMLPSGFVIPPLVTTLEMNVFSFAHLPRGFSIPPTVTTIGPSAFEGATLPGGFTIPSTTTIYEQTNSGGSASFSGVHLPANFAWRDANGVLLADQNHPVPGCSVWERSTDADTLIAAEHDFTPEIRTQTLSVHLDHALAENETNATVINAALLTKLPTALPSGVSVTYHVGAVDRATLIQTIDVTISAGRAMPHKIQIHLTYAGVTLAAFRAAYPNKLSADGTEVVFQAFSSTKLASDFALPETVTTIGAQAFIHASFSGSFKLSTSITRINRGAFWQVNLPAGFTIPTSVITIEDAAFVLAHLPAGFSIPSTTTIIRSSSEFTECFWGSKLPVGYEWHDEHGNRIKDPNNPTPGCVVAPIAHS